MTLNTQSLRSRIWTRLPLKLKIIITNILLFLRWWRSMESVEVRTFAAIVVSVILYTILIFYNYVS